MLKNLFKTMYSVLKSQRGAVGVYWDGRRFVRPQAVTRIDDAGMYGRGLAGANVLALIGEATGGEPKKVHWLTDPSYAKVLFRSGSLLQAIQRAYDPSSQVYGAYSVAAIRVNPATQATLILKDSLYNPLITLTSVDYGIWNNQLRVRVENGTLSGKKLTVTYGTYYEQGNNIERKSFYIACGDPLLRAGSYAVSITPGSKTLTTVIVSNYQKVYYDDNGVVSDVTTAAKELDSSYFSVGLVAAQDYIYIGSDQPFAVATFNRGSGLAQDIVAALSGEYYNGSTWSSLTGFVDGTKGAGNKPFSTNGNIIWTLPSDWSKTTYQANNLYWVRLKSSVSLTAGGQGDFIWLQRGLNINLVSYPTIQELVDYIDSQPHYEVGSITTKPESEYSYELDDVTAANLLPGGNTTLLDPYSTGLSLSVNSITNFAIGDYIVVARTDGSAEESRRITAVGAGTLGVDSALSYTYSAGSIVREAATLNSDLQAVIGWFNDNSGYVEAEYSSTAVNRAVVANIIDTYLAGGSEGVASQSDWDECIGLLQTEEVHLISCVSYDPAVWASLSTHCSYMSSIGKKERIGFCGGFSSDDGYTSGLGKWNNTSNIGNSIQSMLNYAHNLNSDRMVYIGPGFSAYNEEGVLTTYSGAISAALVAGMAAGVDVAEALTHKSIKVIGLEYNLKWADLDRLLEGGVCPLEYEAGTGYRVCQSITTWLRNDKYNRRELSVRRTADYVARQVRDRLEKDFVGTKGTITTLISIKNATISTLTQMVRLELLAGDATNPPFKNVQVSLEGDVAYVDFECSPCIPINYILCTIHLTIFQTTLTA